jgi:hypothetical protein
MFVVSFFQLGEVGRYLIWGTWFPNHLPLDETDPYQTRLGCNWLPTVPGVQDPDTIDSEVERILL